MRVLAVRVRGPVCAEAAFAALYGDSRYAFWLDSSLPGEPYGRWSFLGDAGGPYARVVTADTLRGTVTTRGRAGVRTVRSAFLDWLAAEHRPFQVELPELTVPFPLGWVGYLGYELKAECGGGSVHRSRRPDAALLFADRMIAVDHLAGEAYLLALDDGSGDADGWLSVTGRRLAGLRPLPEPAAPPVAARLRARHGRDHYLRLVARCQDAIRAGDTYEVCLTNELTAPIDLDPFATYRYLRRLSPAPYAGYLRFGGLAVLSTSPERFLAVAPDGMAESRPIKGTRPRGTTPAEDARLRDELVASGKDRAENLMIVDLVRNDLARVAEPGTVEVAGLCEVESYANVHQLVSTVRARLRPDRTATDCVRAAFPGGSMTGAPKISTMRLLDELEAGPRGVYAGAYGYLALSGAVDLAMVIRTAVLGGGALTYGVGGAIVADSDPVAEYDETVTKAVPLLRLLGTGFPA